MLLLHPDDMINETQAQISGRRLKHLVQTHQITVGKILSAGFIDGLLGTSQILKHDNKKLLLDVSFTQEAPKASPITVILALPRPKSIGRILQSLTSLGIKSIHLINSFRVEKSFWQSTHLNKEVIQKELYLGLEQARDTLLPKVHFHRGFRPFVEDLAPKVIENKRGLLAHPYSQQSLKSLLYQQQDLRPQEVLAVGPEGGWIDYEIQKFQEIGFFPFCFGERVLKLETALTALISRIQF